MEIPVAFKPSFYGLKNVYAKVTDDQGRTTGWKQVGTWLASDDRPPEAVSVVPYLGSGPQRTFTFAFSDQNGGTGISGAEFLIQFDKTQRKACSFSLDRSAGVVTLRDDRGSLPVGSLRLGDPGSVGNAQCTISDVSVKPEGRDSIIFSTHIRFSSSFSGRRNIYARVVRDAAAPSSMQWLGSWVVPQQ
jgi:hypothetical protein